jgi:hypothetical protein
MGANRLAGICVLLAAALTGCYSSVAPNTDFPPRLRACTSLIECQVVEQQARRDVAECAKQQTIYVLAQGPTHLSCDDASRNLKDAEEKVAKLRETQVEQQQADLQARQEESIQRRADALRAQRESQVAADRNRLEAQASFTQQTVDRCEATRDARARRRQHAEILQQSPSDTVQKKCTPQRAMQPVQAQCTDSNGFVRSCTKQVPGDVVGYACPKSVDPDVAKLGAYQLGLGGGVYPFPDDLSIGVQDQQCDTAAARLQAIHDQLGGSDAGAGAQNLSGASP